MKSSPQSADIFHVHAASIETPTGISNHPVVSLSSPRLTILFRPALFPRCSIQARCTVYFATTTACSAFMHFSPIGHDQCKRIDIRSFPPTSDARFFVTILSNVYTTHVRSFGTFTARIDSTETQDEQSGIRCVSISVATSFVRRSSN